MHLNAFQLVRPRGSVTEAPPPLPAHGYPRAVDQLSLDSQFIRTWPSGFAAARELGYGRGGAASISKCANFAAKHALGFKWRFAEVKR